MKGCWFGHKWHFDHIENHAVLQQRIKSHPEIPKLLIGLYSNEKNMESRGRAIQATWMRQNSSYWRVIVFAKIPESKKLPGFSYIALSNVDDYQYPPQKKSFAALRHVANHYAG